MGQPWSSEAINVYAMSSWALCSLVKLPMAKATPGAAFASDKLFFGRFAWLQIWVIPRSVFVIATPLIDFACRFGDGFRAWLQWHGIFLDVEN
jgi:hypothetical protein